MLLSFLQGDFNLLEFLERMLLSLPAFVLALSMHEAAHGYVAMRCGDPTAKLMGRLTLNPFKHLDPIGFACMFFAGVGWAKPVPVNPRNFKKPRRDDLLVSLAGITMNLTLFVLGALVMYAMVAFAIARLPQSAISAGGYILSTVDGQVYGFTGKEAFSLATGMQNFLFAPHYGRMAGYIYEIFVNFAVVNLVLAIFNLMPVPPLDGYHVLNDLVLKKDLFAAAKVARIGQAAILLLALTGLLGKGLGFVIDGAFTGLGNFFYAAFSALHIL